MNAPYVAGIDLSTHAIDVVALNENCDAAEWVHLELDGATAWDRVRKIRLQLNRIQWDDCYLAAIERPFSRSRNDTVRLAQGAVLASIPPSVAVWEVAPQTWKSALGLSRKKPTWDDLPAVDAFDRDGWSQDARDALAVALYARNENARGIAKALAAS